MIINVDNKLRGERGVAYKKIMLTTLKIMFFRFKVFESTVQKVSVFSLNCIFFGNSASLYFNNSMFYLYNFSSAAPVQLPCFSCSMFQLLLASISNTHFEYLS